MTTNPALIGKAGELMVAAELMRRGIEVAYPASDVGVDLLAYRFAAKSNRFRFVLCRSRSKRDLHLAIISSARGLIVCPAWFSFTSGIWRRYPSFMAWTVWPASRMLLDPFMQRHRPGGRPVATA